MATHLWQMMTHLGKIPQLKQIMSSTSTQHSTSLLSHVLIFTVSMTTSTTISSTSSSGRLDESTDINQHVNETPSNHITHTHTHTDTHTHRHTHTHTHTQRWRQQRDWSGWGEQCELTDELPVSWRNRIHRAAWWRRRWSPSESSRPCYVPSTATQTATSSCHRDLHRQRQHPRYQHTSTPLL